jgi:hypothetical protein
MPDFAPTVDIHRKPGYDPAELFLNPDLAFPKLRIAARLLRKFSGMRYYMDVIPTRADMVRGSHGRITTGDAAPVLLSSSPVGATDELPMTGVFQLILETLADG